MPRPTPPENAETLPGEINLTVADWVPSHVHAIPVAGLLAHKPALVDAHLTATEWQAELDAYLVTERP